ncbi:hypothetical protein MJH12_20185, partial [bacterium]|nr:hypothetical protein [bacterium]
VNQSGIFVLNRTSPIDDFEIMPFSAFANSTFTHNNVDTNSITESIWANRVLTGVHFTNGTISNVDLEDNSFKAEVFLDNAFTTSKFTGLITTATIASRAISSRAILDGAILESHIEDNSFTAKHFKPNTLDTADVSGNIQGVKLESQAVTNIKVNLSNRILNSKISTNSISNDQISACQLNSTHIAENTLLGEDFGNINASAFATNSVSSDNIILDTILSTKISANTLTNAVLKSNAVIHGHMIDNIITSGKINDASITGDLFNNGVITNLKVSANTILSANLLDARIDGANMKNDLDNTSILNATLINDDLTLNSFSDTQLLNSAVQNNNIVDLSLREEKIANNAITNTLLIIGGGQKISGISFADRAFGSNEIDDSTIGTSNINASLGSVNIGAITLEDADFAISTLTKSDFVSTFVTGLNVLDNSINNNKLNGIIVGSGGLALDNLQIQSTHVNSNLQGSILENSSIENRDLPATLTTIKIQDATITLAKIVNSTIKSSHFVNEAILNVHIATNLVTSAKLQDGSFGEDDVLELTGAEIQDLTLATGKIDDYTIENSDLRAGSFGATEILTIEFADLAGGFTFSKTHFFSQSIENNDFADNQIQGTHFSGTLPIDKFDLNTITSAKLDYTNAQIKDLFGGDNADSHHTHNMLDQEVFCSAAGASKVGTSGNAFCIIPNLNLTLDNQHNTYNAATINDITVRGRMCNAEQLWRANQSSAITNFSQHHSSDFMVAPKGLGGSLTTLLINTLNTTDASGTFLETTITGESQTIRSAWCF